ncbi:MAG: immunoglobulin domain-containing protein [Candidatus Omnitrophica bacterium]|nr:immunoglobulin domain-containing protein [Candidatus Omnitrophota bacterium]
MKIRTFLSMVSFIACFASNTQADITSGLIAHWAFDESNGLIAADSSGLGNNATLFSFQTDNSQWVPGVIGGALFFNSDTVLHDDYVMTDNPITFTNQQQQYSFSFWIKRALPATGTYPRVISPVEGSYSWWVLWGNGGGVGMSLNALPSDSDPVVGQWTHYVVVANQDAKTYSVYNNTVPVLTDVPDGQGPPGTVQWMIGHTEMPSQHGDFWIGALDDVRIYNRLLDAADVQELFNLAPTTTPSNAPVFVQQPQGGNRYTGCSFTIRGLATADPSDLTYQWQKDGVDIPGANDVSLALSNLQLSDSGSYVLVASGSAGTVSSQPAVLQVQTANVPSYDVGMVAHWAFDETNGLVAADASLCGGNNATLYNFPTNNSEWVRGRIGGALYFNSDVASHDDYVLTDMPMVFNNQDAFSFSFWMKRSPGATGSFPRVITPLNQTHWILWGQGNGIGFYPPPLAGEPAIGTWQHYAVVYDRAAALYSVYLDGNLVLADAGADRASPGDATWIIGHNETIAQNGDHWFGMLDDIRVYNRLLTADDVTQLFQAAPPTQPYAPAFYQQPISNERFVGESQTFSAYADGDPAVTFQWLKNGQPIPDATNIALTLNNLRLEDAGTYTLVASNQLGIVSSDPAVLKVSLVPEVPDYTSGLVAHWAFDETSGLAAADSTTNANNAALVNFPADDSEWVTGRVGGALRYNMLAGGVLDDVHGDYVITDAPITFTNQDRFTFCFWIKREDPARGSFPRVITPQDQNHWILWGGGSGVGFYPPPAIPEPAVGAWQHYAVVYDRAGGTYSVFLDGVKVLTDVAGAARSAPGAANWILGHNENVTQHGDQWYGELDDVRIYNRLLSATDVGALFESAPPIVPTIGQQSQGTFYKLVGQDVTLSVQAAGGQLQYQWQKNGQAIAGATNKSLSIAQAQAADAGTYTVIVSNTAGTITSSAITLQVQPPATPVDLDYGLVAHWTFDETSGITATDSSGRTNNASLINFLGDNSQWAPGRIDGALQFNLMSDGSLDPLHADYVVTDAPIELDNQDEFSFSFWMNRVEGDIGTYPRVISPYQQPTVGWILWGGANQNGVGFYPPQLAGEPLIGAWQHYVVVYNRAAGLYSVYVNGVQQLSNAQANRDAPGATYWMIGHNELPTQDNDQWYGSLDDVRMYNRLLTDADVGALAGLGGITPAAKMSIALVGNQVVISWTGTGTLQTASQLAGPWTDVSGATSPHTETPADAAKFYRIRQ